MTQEQIDEILSKHKLWMDGMEGGKKLSSATPTFEVKSGVGLNFTERIYEVQTYEV